MKNEILAVIVVLLVAGGLGVSYFASRQTLSGTTASSVATPQSTLRSSTLSTCIAGGTITGGAGQSSPPCGCVLVDSNSGGSLYVSPNPKVGDNICIQATLMASTQVYLTVTDSAGSVAFTVACAATGGTGGTGIVSSDTCLALWNTAEPDPQGNAVVAGTYHLVAGGSPGAVSLDANFTLS